MQSLTYTKLINNSIIILWVNHLESFRIIGLTPNVILACTTPTNFAHLEFLHTKNEKYWLNVVYYFYVSICVNINKINYVFTSVCGNKCTTLKLT